MFITKPPFKGGFVVLYIVTDSLVSLYAFAS